MAFATTQDIATRAGRDLDATEAATVELLLDGATALILSEVTGSTEAWVTTAGDETSTDPPQAVKTVCVEVVYRAWSNPDALARMEVADVAAYSRATAEDALWLTDRERRTVQRAAGRSSFRAVTLESPYSGTADSTTDLLA